MEVMSGEEPVTALGNNGPRKGTFMNYLENTPENRALGFSSGAQHAPLWAQTYIQEYRAAIVEKRAMNPTYLASFVRGAEKRVAEAGAREDAALRAMLAAVGEEIRRQSL